MKNPNLAKSNSFPDEMQVDLNMFGALMLHRVCREVDCTHVVTVNESDLAEETIELL